MNSTLRSSPLRDALNDPEQFPLQAHAHSQLDEVCIQRIWSKVDTRPVSAQSKAHSLVSSGNGLFALASAALFILGFIGTVSFWDQNAALRLETGALEHELESTIQATQTTRVLGFEDGSRIEMTPGATLSVLSNEGRSFVTKLNEGRARFSVKPGGSRRWIVEAGDVSVEVVGTVFTVERQTQGTLVSVERGTVIVSGSVPQGKVSLTRGMRIESTRLALAKNSQASDTEPEAVQDSVPAPGASLPGISLSELEDEQPDSPSSTASEAPPRAGNAPQAPRTVEPKKDPLADLLVQGDAARRQGDLTTAAQAYGAAAQMASPSDPRGAMASLSFAKVSSDPTAIMHMLKSGLPAMPPSLREPALARLVRACQQAGRLEEAASFATQYKREFPAGPRLKLVSGWAAQP